MAGFIGTNRIRKSHRHLWILLLTLFLGLPFCACAPPNTSRELGLPPIQSEKEIEKWILFYSNLERTDRDLKPLLYDDMLRSTARWQAGYCSQIGYLNHFADVDSMRTTGERIYHFAGGEPKFWGENLVVIFRTNVEGKQFRIRKDMLGEYRDFGSHKIYWRSEQQIGEIMVEKWMKSPLHRRNLLSESFQAMGPAAVSGSYRSEYSFYGAQVFASGTELGLRNFAIRKKGTVDGKRELHLKLFNRPDLVPVVFGYGHGKINELEGVPDRDGFLFSVPPDDEADRIYRFGARDPLLGIYYPVRRVEWAPERYP